MSEVRFENPDSPELVRASQLARANFRFMWREMDKEVGSLFDYQLAMRMQDNR